jgi:hypothetical protein
MECGFTDQQFCLILLGGLSAKLEVQVLQAIIKLQFGVTIARFVRT